MLVPASRSISRSSSTKGTPRWAAQSDQRDPLLASLRVGETERAGEQRMRCVELRLVEPGEQVVQAGQRGPGRVLQQFEDGDVQRARRGLERIDRDIALAGFDIGQ